MAQDGSGASLVFEIVERADVADDGAARYHFDDVADAAAAVSRAVVATGSVSAPTAPVCVVALGNITMTKAESTDGAHSVDVGIAASDFPTRRRCALYAERAGARRDLCERPSTSPWHRA